MLAHQLHELGPIACLTDDIVPAPLEQAREALAHQNVILGDDDSFVAMIVLSHGLSISQRVPGPRKSGRFDRDMIAGLCRRRD